MTNKQELKTREKIDEHRNLISINKRIRDIQLEVKKLSINRISELYKLLSEYIKLKRVTNKRYGLNTLSFDPDLKIGQTNVRYIFSYKYLSSYTKRLIEEEKIEESTACFITFKFAFLREAGWQNKIINLFLDKKITISQLAELNKQEIKNIILGEKVISDKERYFISTTKTLRSILIRLKKEEKELQKYSHLDSLRNTVKEINNYFDKIAKEMRK